MQAVINCQGALVWYNILCTGHLQVLLLCGAAGCTTVLSMCVMKVCCGRRSAGIKSHENLSHLHTLTKGQMQCRASTHSDTVQCLHIGVNKHAILLKVPDFLLELHW